MWRIQFSKQAKEDIELLKAAGLDAKARTLLEVMRVNPFQNPPPYEKLKGCNPTQYSRRINAKHRLHYFVLEENKTIRIIRMWSHYE